VVVLVQHEGAETRRPTVPDNLVRGVGRPHRSLEEMPGEHMPSVPVAAILKVLLVPP